MAHLVNDVTQEIVELILSGAHEGYLPPQTELAAAMNVSRTVLREAIAKLEYLGVLVSRPKIGTQIMPSSQWKVVNTDVIEWRVRAGETKDEVFESIELQVW